MDNYSDTDTIINLEKENNWINKKNFPHNFCSVFTEILSECNMTKRSKLITRERFLDLYYKYNTKYNKTKFHYTFSRIVIGIGGIIVPALVTLDNTLTEKSEISIKIGYITFSVSIVVFIINILFELQSISKKYYTYSSVNEEFISEGWYFLSLTGRYNKYINHSECWRTFISNLEELNNKTVNSSLIITKEENEKNIKNSLDLLLKDTKPKETDDFIEENKKTIIYTNN